MAVLKGNKNFYDYEVSDALANNLQRWLEYGLLEMGAYTVVSFNTATSGLATLQRSHDERYGGAGRVYEGMGPGWVWENDVNPISVGLDRPIVASGVHVNNTFYSTAATSGTYAHKIDFRNGRVIFDSPLPASAQVKCEYTFRDVAVYHVDGPEWKTIVQGSQTYQEQYENLSQHSPSGMAQILKQNRVWLPAVVVDVGDRTMVPLQLGGGEIASFTVDYHVFSDKPFTNRRLSDLLNNQYDQVLDLFDLNNLQFPYKHDGTLASGAVTYPVLGNRNGPYFWTYARIADVDGGPRHSATDLYRSELTHTIEVDRYLITY